MTTEYNNIDSALMRLSAGESFEAVIKDFPELQEELLPYASMLEALPRMQTLRPSESGLHTALRSVRALPTQGAPTPSPFAFVQFTKYSFAYKSAFVLPVLLIALIASGAYVLPRLGLHGVSTLPTDDTQSLDGSVTGQSATFSESASAPQNGTMMKTMALAPAAQPTLPQDTTLAAIYGPELSHDVQAVQEDSVQATSIADDTNDTQGYTEAYDENAF